MKRLAVAVILMFALSAVGGFAEENKPADETKAAGDAKAEAGGKAVDEAQQKKYDLRYNRLAQSVIRQKLSAEIKSVTMEGSPLGLEGWMKSNLEYTGSGLDEEKQSFLMRLQLNEIRQEFNGAPLKGSKDACVGLVVSARGEMLGKEEGGGDIAVMGSAGMPAELVALLVHLVRFPYQPVAVDDEWEFAEVLKPGGEARPIPVMVTTRLCNVEDERYAWLVSEINLQVPSFKMPNPMGSGDPVPVNNAELDIIDLSRVFDMDNGVVVKAEGKVEFRAQVDMGGFPLNIAAESTFAMGPSEDLETPAATVAENPGGEGAGKQEEKTTTKVAEDK